MENGEAPLFVMYQRAEGVLDALYQSRDTVTVTQQESFNSQSWSLAELKAGESFKYSKWGGYGEDKTLVIKVCSSSVKNNVDSSSVIIYMEGFTTASCQPIVTDPPTDPPTATPQNDTGGCEDTPLQFLAGGRRRRCGWAKWNTQKRCGFWGVPSMCPQTCGVCPMCSDGRKKFVLENGKLKSCWWVRNKNTMKRCQRLGVAETCRKTCGKCS